MTSRVAQELLNFLQSLAAIGAGLLNSVYALFQAILALGREVVGSALQLVQVIVNFAANLFQGVLGFVIANFFAILIKSGVRERLSTWMSNTLEVSELNVSRRPRTCFHLIPDLHPYEYSVQIILIRYFSTMMILAREANYFPDVRVLPRLAN
ncbi:hypothetical protein A0H81_00568 [Grifola frondosa]|uniref:Uncharacterized protein n=1 Tax=Grifola frondosa TaxID=5627 RepID=A0A1C7MT99_GRIFR|nr:hypothetical protein A0H81_00568 [Grifola frondosa]